MLKLHILYGTLISIHKRNPLHKQILIYTVILPRSPIHYFYEALLFLCTKDTRATVNI